MKVLHVTTGMRKASGVTTFVDNVTAELKERGVEVSVVMKEADLASCDVVHIHGLWSPLLHHASGWARQMGIPVVWSTHGMTAPWSMRHKWWKKMPAWLLYQRRDLKAAAAVHCTTELEQEWNQTLGFKRCFVAPLGTTLPNLRSTPTPKTYTSTLKTLLFVGRIYPVKALDRLIEAFARVDESIRRNWTLRLVGPDQADHMAELMALCNRLGLTYSAPEQNGEDSTVGLDLIPRPHQGEFVGPKFDEGLDAEYANCDALALVSHTENFGATVVDALAHGKPVITSTKTPWKIVADNKCGWWVSNDIEPLSTALVELMTTSDAERMEKGECGRKLVEDHYTWSAVCDKMIAGYEEALNGRA